MNGVPFLRQLQIALMNAVIKPCFYLMYIHGLRVSEVIGLTLSDMDLKEKIIYIRCLKNGFLTVHPLHMDELSLLNE